MGGNPVFYSDFGALFCLWAKWAGILYFIVVLEAHAPHSREQLVLGPCLVYGPRGRESYTL